MLNVTSPKVAIPVLLFIALSPTIGLNTTNVNIYDILFRSLLFLITYTVIARALGTVLSRTDLIVTTGLFILLNPGVLLTIPPGSRGVFMSGQGNLESLLSNAVIYAIKFAFLRKYFPQFY